MIASGRRGLRSTPASVCPTASPRLPRAERDTTLAAKARTVCRQSSVDGGRIVSAENPGGASASTGSRPSSAVPASAKASTYSAGRKTASLTAWLQRAACTRSEPAQARQGHAREGKTGAGRRRRHAGAGGDEDRRMHPDVQHDAVGQAPARLQGLVAGGDHEHGHGRGPEANRTGKPPHSGGAAPPAIKARIVRMVPSSSERRAGTRPRRRTAESPVAMPRQARPPAASWIVRIARPP